MKRFSKIISVLLSMPLFVFAANTFPSDVTGIINMFIGIGLRVVPFLGAVAFLVFIWGIAKFIKSAGSEKEVKDSKNLLIWGVVGIFVLVTIWGIVFFLQKEFGFNTGSTPIIPQIKFNVK